MISDDGAPKRNLLIADVVLSVLLVIAGVWFVLGMPTSGRLAGLLMPVFLAVTSVMGLRSIRGTGVQVFGVPSLLLLLRRLGGMFVDIFAGGVLIALSEPIGAIWPESALVELAMISLGITYVLTRNVGVPSVGFLVVNLRVTGSEPLSAVRIIVSNALLFAPGLLIVSEGASGMSYGPAVAMAGILWVLDVGGGVFDGSRLSDRALGLSVGAAVARGHEYPRHQQSD